MVWTASASQRGERQPGDDQTFRVSEGNFVQTARGCLDPAKYVIEPQPRVLADVFAAGDETPLGVIPEVMIRSRETGRMLFVEVKKQGPRGNAEERSYKHHTVQFYKTSRIGSATTSTRLSRSGVKAWRRIPGTRARQSTSSNRTTTSSGWTTTRLRCVRGFEHAVKSGSMTDWP